MSILCIYFVLSVSWTRVRCVSVFYILNFIRNDRNQFVSLSLRIVIVRNRDSWFSWWTHAPMYILFQCCVVFLLFVDRFVTSYFLCLLYTFQRQQILWLYSKSARHKDCNFSIELLYIWFIGWSWTKELWKIKRLRVILSFLRWTTMPFIGFV